jgi:microcystin-dependent protein
MAQPYVGEIRIFAGNFPPVGWMFCDGQVMPISENETLFQLIGTTYGGDGESTFALPNLQSRIPIHFGTGGEGTYQLAEASGVEEVTLTVQQIPSHSHPMLASTNLTSTTVPTNNLIGKSTSIDSFINAGADTPLHPNAVQPQGGSQPHDNMQPYLCMNYIISLFGLFPSQT